MNTSTFIGYHKNLPVHLIDDQSDFISAGVDSQGNIYVNEVFMALPNSDWQLAILEHEVGHYVYQHHLAEMDYNLIFEWEADRYALECGADILGALSYLRVLYHDRVDVADLDSRIRMIQRAMNP